MLVAAKKPGNRSNFTMEARFHDESWVKIKIIFGLIKLII